MFSNFGDVIKDLAVDLPWMHKFGVPADSRGDGYYLRRRLS